VTLWVILFLGCVLMTLVISRQMEWYQVAKGKSIIVVVALVCTGLIGSYIWYYVENNSFGGRSFYGAVYLSPLVFYIVAKKLKIQYGVCLDFVAPAGCVTLALVKIQCLIDRCCIGRVLYIDENHMYVRFPSQIVEMIAFFLIAAILLYMSSKEKYRGKIFPYFLTIYGVIRFVLDFQRETVPMDGLHLSAGSFWSLCSFVVGTICLLKMRKGNSGYNKHKNVK